MSYPCTSCGICCNKIKNAVENSPHLDFPYTWDKNGKCDMLTSDNKCSVYDDRPLICNIDKFIEVSGVDKDQFYAQNIEVCNKWIKESKMSKKFLIK